MEVSAVSSSPPQCSATMVEAIQHNPKLVEALGKFDCILDSAEETTISPETRASLRSCLEQVRSDPTNAKAWTALGDITSECAPAPLPEDLRDCKRQCYVEALKHDPKFSTAWKQLGKTLRGGDEATVNGSKYREKQCYVEALLHDPSCADLWYNLGVILKETELVTVKGTRYTPQKCYIEALRHNPTLSRAWCAMSPTLKVDGEALINGQSYAQKECLVEALTHDSKNWLAWYRLGNALGSAESATVRDATYTKRQCYIESLTNNPTHAFSWANLAAVLTQDVKVIVNGRSYTRQECCIEVLQIDTNHPRVWANLGASLVEPEVAVISDSRYTKRECLLEAIRLDPTSKPSWLNLANSMDSSELVLVGGSMYTRAECRRKYYELRYHERMKGKKQTETGDDTPRAPLSMAEAAAIAVLFVHWKRVSGVRGGLRRLRREAESRLQRGVLHNWFDWFFLESITERPLDGPFIAIRSRFVIQRQGRRAKLPCPLEPQSDIINNRVTATLVHGRSTEDTLQLVEAVHRSTVPCPGMKAIPNAEFLGSYCSIEGHGVGSPPTAAASDYFLHGGAGFPFPPLPVHRPSGRLMSPALLLAIQTGGLNGREMHSSNKSTLDSPEEAMHRPLLGLGIEKELQLYVVPRLQPLRVNPTYA